MNGSDEAPLVLVKLGGSLITEKSGDAEARADVIARLAREIAEGREDAEARLLVGHGSGSFGHPPAAEHDLRHGTGDEKERLGLSRTQHRAARLHRRVVGALIEAGVPAFSVVPSSAGVAEDGRVADFAGEPLLRALGEGHVPVVYGDVMMDRSRGSTIASTEAVFLGLARLLDDAGWRVGRALWLGPTDGVLGPDGRTLPRIEGVPGGDLPEAVGGSGATDVTGGMRHRVETALLMADLGIPSWIGDGRRSGSLRRALAGDLQGGTRVPPAAR
ncbi:MAG: isopentenyl phosphate kinase [Candidatus Palauibacterales bacterium]|nr:isopentenyl phosphate kinase [Candidatus Palauibacterales bacterium]